MEDPPNAHVLSELLISKEVLEDYFGEHNLPALGSRLTDIIRLINIFWADEKEYKPPRRFPFSEVVCILYFICCL